MAVALQTLPPADLATSPFPAEPARLARRSPAAQLRHPAGFAVTVSESSAGARVAVSGELDMLTAPRLRSVLRSCAEQSGSDLEIDLGQLEFIDARGISVLVEIRRYLGEQHRRLVIVSLSAPARRLLDLTDLTSTFTSAAATSGPQG